MLQHLWKSLQKLAIVDDPVAELPVESTIAGGKFVVQMRVLELACGHSELLADVIRTDSEPREVILLDRDDLHELCGVLLDGLQRAEQHIARQL
jgi:hypothetical protein